MSQGSEPLVKKVEDARKVAHDTNKRVRTVEDNVGPWPLPKRLAVFGLVVLILYLVLLTLSAARDSRKSADTAGMAVRDLGTSLGTLLKDNERLTFNNQTLLIENQRLNRERTALINITVEQAERLREAGLPAVDPFDPRVNGGASPTPRPSSTRPSGSSSPQPTPRPTSGPKPTPSPSRAPLATICAPNLPCITTPPLPILNVAAVSTKESEMDSTLASFDALTVSRWLGILVPIIVALVTKKYASSGLKSALNVVSSAIIGSVGYLVAEDGGYNLAGFLNSFFNTFLVSVAAYYGVLKPTGIAGTVTNLKPDTGLGTPELTTDDVGAEEAGGPDPVMATPKKKAPRKRAKQT